MRLIANIRTFAATFRVSFRSSLESKMSVCFSFINTIIVTLILFGIFQVAFAQSGSIRGLTFSAAMWSLAMYSLWWGIGIRNVFTDISMSIKDGSIETRLVRPQHFLAYIAAFRLGKQVVFFLLQILVNGVLLFLLVGAPPVDPTAFWCLSIATLFLGGMIIALCMYACIGLTTFWLEDSQPVMWIVDKSTMILGGSFVPVALLPSMVRRFAEWSPFGAIMSFAQAFAPDFSERFPSLILSQMLWIVILGILCSTMWSMGRKNIAINGG